VGADPQNVSPTSIQNFRAVVEIFQPSEGDSSADASSASGFLSGALKVLPWLCGSVVFIGLAVFGWFFIRKRIGSDGMGQGAFSRQEDAAVETDLDVRLGQAAGVSDPLATFRTIYSLGDDLYDDSFSIESPSGDFLGECGVGIGDFIGVGEPKKVSAFEVWLFDKNDIQTVTKVLMSDYAFNDPDSRNRLAAKGDPVVAQPGGVIELETASLMVEARIVDLTYGEGALPSQSFFERVAVELRAWPKDFAIS
jgi:hypothetical protein